MNLASEKRPEAGFGLMETLTGLFVFVVLAVLATKGFRAVVVNHKEANQVKALTDAVATTVEQLSALTVSALTGTGSPHLHWSEPKGVGSGPYSYRYRTIPNPKVGGAQSGSVAGLEVEVGELQAGVFVPGRKFATLIAPHLASKNQAGEVTSQKERDAEAAFHSGLQARIANLSAGVVGENENRLNSFNCYDKGECCDFMRKYFANPDIKPMDGLEQKCHYRCALGGDVPMKDWKASCGIDFCAMAPWKTKDDCCKAIAAGECKSGSACARACIDCVGEDGSTCGTAKCDAWWWDDLFDCANGTLCDGTPLPDGNVPGWGNVKAMCKRPECSSMTAYCGLRVWTCCENYWGKLNVGQVPDPRVEICATITTRQQCCEWEAQLGNFTLYCSNTGQVKSARNNKDGQWYCNLNTGGWSVNCEHAIGCATTHRPDGAPEGGCTQWTGTFLASPWVDPATGVFTPVTGGGNQGAPSSGDTGGGGVITKGTTGTEEEGGGRTPTTRPGDVNPSEGGRE